MKTEFCIGLGKRGCTKEEFSIGRGCIIPVHALELSHEVYSDEIECEAMRKELEKIGIDLNHCSWSVVAVEPNLGDMGFVDTSFKEKYTDWYAINLIHDGGGKMERVIVLELRNEKESIKNVKVVCG